MVYFSVEEKVSCVNIFTTNFSPTVHYRMRTSLFATFSLLLLTVLPVNSGNETHSFFLFSQFVANTSWIIEFDLKHSSRRSIAPLVTTSSNKLFSITFPFELHTRIVSFHSWTLKLPIRHTISRFARLKKQRYTRTRVLLEPRSSRTRRRANRPIHDICTSYRRKIRFLNIPGYRRHLDSQSNDIHNCCPDITTRVSVGNSVKKIKPRYLPPPPHIIFRRRI